MKLWILRRIGWTLDMSIGGLNEVDGFVVRAASANDARALAVRGHPRRIDADYEVNDWKPGDEGDEVWLDEAQSTCFELTADGEPGTIMRDYTLA